MTEDPADRDPAETIRPQRSSERTHRLREGGDGRGGDSLKSDLGVIIIEKSS
jgi:hypothetical protein